MSVTGSSLTDSYQLKSIESKLSPLRGEKKKWDKSPRDGFFHSSGISRTCKQVNALDWQGTRDQRLASFLQTVFKE